MASKAAARTASKLHMPKFASSPAFRARSYTKDIGPSKTHLLDKSPQDSKPNHQSHASKQGRDAYAAGSEASQATSRKDDRKNNSRAEEEHPEAPKPVIGMNEERGTKGH